MAGVRRWMDGPLFAWFLRQCDVTCPHSAPICNDGGRNEASGASETSATPVRARRTSLFTGCSEAMDMLVVTSRCRESVGTTSCIIQRIRVHFSRVTAAAGESDGEMERRRGGEVARRREGTFLAPFLWSTPTSGARQSYLEPEDFSSRHYKDLRACSLYAYLLFWISFRSTFQF